MYTDLQIYMRNTVGVGIKLQEQEVANPVSVVCNSRLVQVFVFNPHKYTSDYALCTVQYTVCMHIPTHTHTHRGSQKSDHTSFLSALELNC